MENDGIHIPVSADGQDATEFVHTRNSSRANFATGISGYFASIYILFRILFFRTCWYLIFYISEEVRQ